MNYGAILLVSFGGPEGPDEVMPFLRRVTGGRGVPEERLAEVAEHYWAVGGVSPINGQNRALRDALAGALADAGIDLPVVLGNRNSPPELVDVLARLADDGVTSVLALVTAAYASYSGCRQYREDLAAAAAAVAATGRTPPAIDKVRLYFDHPGFVGSFVSTTLAALNQVNQERRARARLVFTTHSIPEAADAASGDGHAYTRQHRAVAEVVAADVAAVSGLDLGWDLVFQSRSGTAAVPWLEPDVNEHLEALAERGVTDVVLVPIGFVSDHMEVVHDLDVEAAATAARCGITLVRAATPGTSEEFVAGLVALIAERVIPGTPAGALTALGPAPDLCRVDCCPNPRGPRPAVAEREGAR